MTEAPAVRAANVGALVLCPELRPPLKHHGEMFHYIRSAAGTPQMARWDGWRWHIWSPALDKWVSCEPREISHFAYLGPAELAPPAVEPSEKSPSEMVLGLLMRLGKLAAERNALAQKLCDAERLAQHWEAEVRRLDPGRFAPPPKPAFPANALKYSV